LKSTELFEAGRMMKRVLGMMLVCVLAQVASAQALVSGHGAAVSADDLGVEVVRVPVEQRAATFGSPQTVQTLSANLYVRRVIANESVKAGIDKVPEVKAALQQARDRILSEYRLSQIDQANQPSLEALQAYALTSYKADPKKFETPEQVRVRHILFRGEDAVIREQAQRALAELKAGADFAALAKERSNDPGSAVKGGDLGFASRGRMVKEFEDAAFDLKNPGDLSAIVQTQFGLHILKLEERKPAGVKPFEEVKDGLMKEAQKTLLTNARLAEQERILKDAKFDAAAIAAFAKAQAAVK
jgi:peptidyl-prolyl cis-trans isomerase C